MRLAALAELEDEDLEGLATGDILRQARSLHGWPAAVLPRALLQRLSTGEVSSGRADCRPPRRAGRRLTDCVRNSKHLGCDRERAAIQREIDRSAGTGRRATTDGSTSWDQADRTETQIEQ